ncbi:GerAB/ArcD/ProY family transporter [archaeon]|jgi:tyrosine-specific transport protein|nr:GerAB/ArcD/ProY family transporter [archaeon]MBT7128375.1 GerAB/ArcD/ProY family transporter [archaeon]
MVNKKFWAAVFTLTGTTIGAGILGLPYVFAKSGFLVGVFWLFIIGAVIIFTNLTLGEITLRTRGKHQLTGYAEKYLGIWGKRLMFFAVAFGIYSALLAYLIGEGESLAQLIPGNTPPFVFAIFFWIIMTLLLKRGLKGLKRVETYGVIIIITIILGIFIKSIPLINPTNLTTFYPTNFAVPFGVVLFALLGFTSIPELRKEIKGQEKLLKKAIILGTLIPIALYIIFSLVFIGILGNKITEVATLSFGPLMTLLGIFTMLTSYFVLSYSIHATYTYDIKTKKSTRFILTSILPLALYILATQLEFIKFTFILGIGGVISGGITGILILLIARKAKKSTRNKKDPEIKIPINIPIIIILSLIFIAGIIIEFVH